MTRDADAGTILVLDDDPGMCETIGDVLEQHGYAVQIATTAQAGLEIVTSTTVQAAIVDLRLPDMSGIDVLHNMRSAIPRPEVIFITGHASLGTAIEAVNGLAFAYLVKPFEMTHLTATVEQALHKQRLSQALMSSNERYRLVAENIADAIFLLDEHTCLSLVNPRAGTITGYSEGELRGRSFLSLLAPDSVERVEAYLRAGAPSTPALTEVELLRKDRQRVAVEMHLTRMSADGETKGLLAVVRDISERRRLEDQLWQAQKIESLGRLAGGIAHDFNNLLTAIGGRCYLMQMQLAGDHPLRNDVEIIKSATDRAARLTHQLLAFSRKQVLEPRVLDLNAIVHGIEPLLRRMISEDIELVTVRQEGLGQVKADRGQLEQVLVNLAVNARDAMAAGGRLIFETQNVVLEEAYARSTAEVKAGRYVMLAVSDTGHGMDLNTKARIFDPFFTTKEVGKGTGLGLATVHGIVKQSGGHVAVYSEPGHGTTFKVYLPRVDEPPVAEEAVIAPAPGGSETILLVEDDEGLRSLARDVLAVKGYQVIEASSAEDAIEIVVVRRQRIDLLLTDVVMPRMNGPQLADRLRESRPDIRVLFMSGYTDGIIGHQGALEPGTHFLHKPFTPDGLNQKVREVLVS